MADGYTDLSIHLMIMSHPKQLAPSYRQTHDWKKNLLFHTYGWDRACILPRLPTTTRALENSIRLEIPLMLNNTSSYTFKKPCQNWQGDVPQ